MNTVSVIVAVILTIVYFAVFFFLVKLIISKAQTAFEKGIIFFVLLAYIGFGVISAVAGLNLYGIGRLPLLNEVRSRLPESFNPPEKPSTPPVNGQMQTPSQQMFEQHQKQMEKLKRDGF